MATDLRTQAREFDVTNADFAIMLGKIQANILKPHGRDFARHAFLEFTGSASSVKTWIRTHVLPIVTTAAQQHGWVRGKDGGTVCGFFLSAAGYEHLGYSTRGFHSKSFRKGMKNQADGFLSELFDTDNNDPAPGKWEESFRGDIHALLTFADDDADVAERAVADLERTAAGAVRFVCVERGNVLRRKKEPVEHFGYFDGISQPVFTRQDWLKEIEKNPQVDDWDPGAALELVLADDPLTETPDSFGSYLVYRKLAQDVAAFNTHVIQLAGVAGIDPDLAGALVVGRFKNGTPVLASPTPATTPFTKQNDFNFRADDDGVGCPFHAHIRKANPRGTTPLTTSRSERGRRIARRGIPYGPPIDAETADNIPPDARPDTARGLLFMCFQANVEDQFEFIQRTWVDNRNFPKPLVSGFGEPTGDDPVIGQDEGDAGQRWPSAWNDPKAPRVSFDFRSAVALKGGEYFFAPSLPFLRSL